MLIDFSPKVTYMKTKPVTIILFFIFFIYSCGGVIGNIEKYSLPNISSGKLKEALNKVYIKHPELIKSDTTMYGNNNGDEFYYVLTDNGGQKIIFECSAINSVWPNDKETELSLTSAAIWGETMKLAPKMSFFEKRKYRNLFEENILPKIKEELK